MRDKLVDYLEKQFDKHVEIHYHHRSDGASAILDRKNLYKIVDGLIPMTKMGVNFYQMDQYPTSNPEAPEMSVQVILYDKDDIQNTFIGFYNFDLGKWLSFGDDFDTEFQCWCYPPKP